MPDSMRLLQKNNFAKRLMKTGKVQSTTMATAWNDWKTMEILFRLRNDSTYKSLHIMHWSSTISFCNQKTVIIYLWLEFSMFYGPIKTLMHPTNVTNTPLMNPLSNISIKIWAHTSLNKYWALNYKKRSYTELIQGSRWHSGSDRNFTK